MPEGVILYRKYGVASFHSGHDIAAINANIQIQLIDGFRML